MIPVTRSQTPGGIIRERIEPASLVCPDSDRSCGVPDVSQFHHQRINHRDAFFDRANHINGIENYWNRAKRHLRGCNGVPKAQFHLFLRECGWRFNDRPASSWAILRLLRIAC